MKKNIGILSIILCIITANVWVYAEDNIYTVDEAISYALENDYNLKALETDVKKAETNVTQEMINKRQYNTAFGSKIEYSISSGFQASLYKNGYMLDTANMKLNIANRNYEAGKYKLMNEVKQSFYTYLVNEKKTENAKRNFDKASEQLNQAQLKFNQGQITKIDLDNFGINVMSCENNLNAQKRATELSMMSLKNKMCYTDDELKVSGEVEIGEMDNVTADEAIETAQSHTDIKNLEDSYENSSKRFDIAKKWYSSSQLEYYVEKATMERAENDYRKNRAATELNIRACYNSMVNSYEKLSYLKANLEFVKKQAEVAGLKYEMGQMTADDYITYTNRVYEAESGIDEAKLGALIASYNYRITFTYSDFE